MHFHRSGLCKQPFFVCFLLLLSLFFLESMQCPISTSGVLTHRTPRVDMCQSDMLCPYFVSIYHDFKRVAFKSAITKLQTCNIISSIVWICSLLVQSAKLIFQMMPANQFPYMLLGHQNWLRVNIKWNIRVDRTDENMKIITPVCKIQHFTLCWLFRPPPINKPIYLSIQKHHKMSLQYTAQPCRVCQINFSHNCIVLCIS